MDVRTRWNSLFLMIERFLEQYPAIQAASMDPRLKRTMDRDRYRLFISKYNNQLSMFACTTTVFFLRLERVSDDDMRKCEDFIETMRILYNSTLCVSSDKSATAGQILPILDKLKNKFNVEENDSAFKRDIKEKILTDLAPRYTVCSSFIII